VVEGALGLHWLRVRRTVVAEAPMVLKPVLSAAIALALTSCASNDYGYAYCYDAYRGPVGYRYGPFEPKPACATTAAASAVYTGPYEAGYRGPYLAGPATPAEAR
jgi:hypothetical protein